VVDLSQDTLEGTGRQRLLKTVEVWRGRGLVTHYLLFVISLADRVVNVAGITTRPDESWMLQVARNAIDSQRAQ
jgi:hypothetical protein